MVSSTTTARHFGPLAPFRGSAWKSCFSKQLLTVWALKRALPSLSRLLLVSEICGCLPLHISGVIFATAG